jgi:hypothetical protein
MNVEYEIRNIQESIHYKGIWYVFTDIYIKIIWKNMLKTNRQNRQCNERNRYKLY